MKTSSTTTRLAPLGAQLRSHPRVRLLLHEAEGRHFTDDELRNLTRSFPSLQPRVEAAKALRRAAPEVIDKVVRELCECYPLGEYDEVAIRKTSRDCHYTIAYAGHAMLMDDPQWFDDKLLIWMKTMMRAFEFPDLSPNARLEPAMREKLLRLPPKARSIYHGYERIRQQLREVLPEQAFRLLNPYLTQINETLLEDYENQP